MEYNDNFHDMIARYNRELLEAYRRRQKEETADIPPDETVSTPPETVTQEALPSPPDETVPTPPETVMQEAAPSPPDVLSVAETLPTDTPQPSELGRLQVWVTTASAALPIAGAQVTVSDAAGDEAHTVRYIGETDESGRTVIIPLPAAGAQGSLSPEGSPTPFTLYDIEVYSDGFYRVKNRDVPLYGGVLAVQPVRMIPLPEGVLRGKLVYPESAPTGLEERT